MLLLLAALCSGWLSAAPLQQDTTVAQRIATELIPRVEVSAGMRFRRRPVIAVRSRDQLRLYLGRKMNEQYSPSEMRAIERTYRVFGLVPDSVSVRELLVNVLTEQVAGFYDPDSSKLFVIRGFDPNLVRFIMAHELVHALQDQHTSLNAVMKLHGDHDRQNAGQAVFEGQAFVAGLRVIQPQLTTAQIEQMIAAMRQLGAAPSPNMPQLANAPRFIRDGLLFPYAEGGDFILAFEENRGADSAQPLGPALPVSTEQILHPDRYARHDVPARVRLAAPAAGDTVVEDDDLGEFETRDALAVWGLPDDAASAAAEGWNGDRYEVLGTPQGTVLAWATAWDTPEDGADFARRLRTAWATRAARRADAASRRYEITSLTVNGISVVRLVDAPASWTGWSRLPAVTVSSTASRSSRSPARRGRPPASR